MFNTHNDLTMAHRHMNHIVDRMLAKTQDGGAIALSLQDGADLFKNDIVSRYKNPETKYNKYVQIRKMLKNTFTKTEILQYFATPEHVYEEMQKYKRKRDDKKADQSISVDFTLFLESSILALRDGIKYKIYPQVLFALNCLVCARSNDFNAKLKRSNGVIFTESVAKLVDKNGILSLVRFVPSKQKDGVIYPPEVSPVLCAPKHYDLCKEAFKFLLNEENINLPCYSSDLAYRKKEACGPIPSHHSSNWTKTRVQGLSCYECMFHDYGFVKAVSVENFKKKFKITPKFARHFFTCCAEEGRFATAGTRHKRRKIVNSVLGHAPDSSADTNYLTMSIKNMDILPNLQLVQADQHAYVVASPPPEAVNNVNASDGEPISITKGAYLVAKKLA